MKSASTVIVTLGFFYVTFVMDSTKAFNLKSKLSNRPTYSSGGKKIDISFTLDLDIFYSGTLLKCNFMELKDKM